MSWTFTWEAYGEASITLNNSSNRTVIWQSLIGASSPPFTPVTDPIPLYPGSYFKYMNVGEAEVDLTLLVQGSSAADLWENIRDISYLFNPLLGLGVLGVVTPDGGIGRYLDCYCTSGFSLDESSLQETSARFNLTFFAPYPYWYSGTSSTYQFSLDSPSEWFPIFPLVLNGDAITSTFTVTNEGDVSSPPLWTINGPGTDPVLSNLTTGETLDLSANGGVTLEDTESITIDIKNRIIELNDGTNLLPQLTYDSSFWDLERGTNTIQIQMTDATSDSSIDLEYSTWYLGVV